MKRIILVCMLIAMLGGCASVEQSCKSWESMNTKLPRIITLYSADGSVIRQWKGMYNIESGEGEGMRFIDNGKVIRLSGTIVAEEVDATYKMEVK